MVLVTGVNGNVGRVLVQRLAQAGVATRALTRHPARTEVPAGVELVEGDLTNAASLERALEGAAGLYLPLVAGDLANRVDLDAVMALARQARVERVTLVSSLLAQTHPESLAGRTALQGEQIVRDSGLAWTILRPWEFASNVLAWVAAIRGEGTVRVPTSGRPSPAIHPADIAAVAFHALTESGHEGKIHALTGPEELTPRDKVNAIAAALGRELAFVEQSDPDLLEEMGRRAPDEATAKLMIPGVCGLESPGALPTVREVTGVPARTFRQWAREHAGAFG